MKRAIFTILLFFAFQQLLFAQTFDKNKLDAYFNVLEEKNKWMGNVAISQEGKLIYTRSVGFSDLENQVRATENTKYRIASITKTFTSVLVLKAVEEHQLALDQTLDEFYPNIQHAEKITVQQLLSHRSGIHNFTDDKSYLTWYTSPKSEQEMVKIITEIGSDFEPDSKTAYSNSGYALLTYILEKVYKEPYAELLTKYIAGPLGLKDTYFGGKIAPDRHESRSYRFSDQWALEPETDISVPSGAGGIVSTPADIIKFGEALFSGKLISKENLELMTTMKDGYGLGIFKLPFYEKTAMGHDGGIDGFSSMWGCFPDEKVSFAFTSNGTSLNANSIAIAILSTVFGKPYDIPEFNIDLRPEDLDQYTGVYSSAQIPLKITITKDGKTLIGQAAGQSAFPLEASKKDVFRFDQAGITLEFDPSNKTMVLNQWGKKILFARE